MAAADERKQGPEAKLKGWHVLLMMLGFFGVMFAVNGVFLYSAITSFPGEDVEKSYLQGLNYNSTLEARREQAELGWTVRAGIPETDLSTLVVEIETAEGSPLSLLDVEATLRRRATDDADLNLSLKPSPQTRGRYEAALPHQLAPGLWDILIEAHSSREDITVNARKSVMMK